MTYLEAQEIAKAIKSAGTEIGLGFLSGGFLIGLSLIVVEIIK